MSEVVVFNSVDYWERRYASGGSSGEKLNHEHVFIAAKVREFLRPGVEWVDVGCADGALAAKALIPGIRYTGVDGSRSVLIKAARRLPEHHFIRQDAARPLPDADLVTCFNVLYHIPTDEKADAILSAMAGTGAGAILIVAWNASMAGKELAAHCFYRPLKPPPGYSAEEFVLPGSAHKSLLVCRPV